MSQRTRFLVNVAVVYMVLDYVATTVFHAKPIGPMPVVAVIVAMSAIATVWDSVSTLKRAKS